MIQNKSYTKPQYDVSIVLATKDRAALLDQMLASLKNAVKNISCELIIIEGGSSDNTIEVLRKHGINNIYNESEHLGSGRHSWSQLYNFGFSKATGKWAMFASDDTLFGENCITNAVERLNKQGSEVAGGAFFYKNIVAETGWDNFGIDFTCGSKLLMNYGLVRLDYFRQVGGLDESYKFYCADTDLCYKVYESGRQLIPLPGSLVVHNNVMDAQKQANTDNSQADITLYQKRWQHLVSMETPDPRRLMWQDEMIDALNLPLALQELNSSIEPFWHGLSLMQHNMFDKAALTILQSVQSGCQHQVVLKYLKEAVIQSGEKTLAENVAKALQSMAGTPGNSKSTQISSQKKPPVLSIFMPVYNAARYLPATLDSILNQTFRDFELVIADDGSKDDTLSILERYAKIDKRIKVLKLQHVGAVDARNEAIKHCDLNSLYLLNHDSDDISLPTKLERLVEYLQTHPDIAIVGCFADYFDNDGNFKGQLSPEWQSDRIRQTFGRINAMINSASVIRREVIEKIGVYRNDYSSVDDYDFFARALIAGFELANIPEVLHLIRLHDKSICATQSELQKNLADKIRAYYNASNAAQKVTGKISPLNPDADRPKLSILHTIEFYHPHIGGAEIVIQQLSERLAKRGHQVTVATAAHPQRSFTQLNGVNIEQFDIHGSMANGYEGNDIERYRRFLLEHPADVMMNYAAQQWATDLVFDLMPTLKDKRVNILAPCGYSALADSKTLKWSQFADYFNQTIPQAIPLYDKAIYHSGCYQDYEYAQNHGFTNSVIIPNAVCEEEFYNVPKINFREKYGITTKYMGLCVANFLRSKGHDRLIECVRQMNRPDFTMVLIGKEGDTLNDLRAMAAGLNIMILNDIPRQDTVAAYHQADIFLFASKIEASPLVIIEAKASRTPFVSTDCGNVREWTGGIVCTPEKIAQYANRLLDDDSIRRTLAEEGFKEWKEKLTWKAVVDRYEDLYLKLYNAKSGNNTSMSNNILVAANAC
ncbi:MAG TPA: glycosyltransferase [Phycisphaerales bacterium]|nr:glycosyltransferase [Phycisphaerales bacterium]